MSATILSFLDPRRARFAPAVDWTDQELAEFYRVADILGRSGLAVETDRGVSDEGDPWFVFLRPLPMGDEVIAHFSRIDQRFVAISGAIDAQFEGQNLRDLVDQLIRRQPLLVPHPPKADDKDGDDENGRLFLHPSVVLTAFIATALMQMEGGEGIDPSSPVITLGPDTDSQASDDKAANSADKTDGSSKTAQRLADVASPAANAQLQQIAQLGLTSTQHVVLLGAVALAISSVEAEADRAVIPGFTAQAAPVSGGSVQLPIILDAELGLAASSEPGSVPVKAANPAAIAQAPTTIAATATLTAPLDPAMVAAIAEQLLAADQALADDGGAAEASMVLTAGAVAGVSLSAEMVAVQAAAADAAAIRVGPILEVEEDADLIAQFQAERSRDIQDNTTGSEPDTPYEGGGVLGENGKAEETVAPDAGAPDPSPTPSLTSPELERAVETPGPTPGQSDLVDRIVAFAEHPFAQLRDVADTQFLYSFFFEQGDIRDLITEGGITQVVIFESDHNVADLITFRGTMLLIDNDLFGEHYDFDDGNGPRQTIELEPGNTLTLLGSLDISALPPL